jgi:hypothetical protein
MSSAKECEISLNSNSNDHVDSQHEAAASQFSIKRLLWMMFVAALFLKLGQLTGAVEFFSRWMELSGANSFWPFAAAVTTFAVAIVYIGWFGIRLPYLIARYRDIRKRRKRRYENLLNNVEPAIRSKIENSD